MVGSVTLLSLAFAIQVVLSSPIRARTPYKVKETHYVPRKWTKLGRAPSEHTINLQIGLKQSSFDELERHLYEGILPLQCFSCDAQLTNSSL
jgi:tripeptidyl-peptidase-1